VAKARIRKDFSVKAANLLFPLAARAGGAVRRARWSLGGSVQPPRLLRALKQRHRDWHPNFDARQILAAAEFFSDFVVAQFSPDSTSLRVHNQRIIAGDGGPPYHNRADGVEDDPAILSSPVSE
jgi:hypothetical protein